MKKILKYVSFILVLSSIAVNAAEFINGLEDIPIMNGLEQQHSDAIVFGNEESRLVESILVGKNINFANIEKFYKDTLPQMGWIFQGKDKSTLTFYRDRESLEITRIIKKPLTVRVTVKSKN